METRPRYEWFLLAALFLALFAIIGLDCEPAHAAIPDNEAIKALIGEAGGQGDEELLAHAYALKNRGTLRGVYSINSPQVKKASAETWQRAAKAWHAAVLGLNDDPTVNYDAWDPVMGRTEWRSEYDLNLMAKRGETPESQGLDGGIKIGQTWFYKLKDAV